jgi:nitrous oxidase accessory protein NosD
MPQKAGNSRRYCHSQGCIAACAHRTVEQLEGRLLMAAHIVGSPTVYSTIQSAVNAAAVGATVTVDAGSYAEKVTIGRSITIDGAQAGTDARLNNRLNGSASAESLMSGAVSGGSHTCAFYINANHVTIDGFTVQGETSQDTASGAGIVIAPNRSGTRILNNIIQNNVAGLFLANASSTDAAIIQHNVFRNNNNAGSNGGRGIYTDQVISGGTLTNVTIDSNAFMGNRGGSGTTGLEAACAFESAISGSQTNLRITNNVMDGNGKAVLFFNSNNVVIQGNQVTNALDHYSGTLRFEGNNHNVTIQSNAVYDNTGPAVAVDSKGVPGDSSGFIVTGNNFYNNSLTYGTHLSVVFNGSAYDGSFDARNNWWGSATGPGGDGPGTGDTIYGNGHVVSGSSWSVAPGGTELFSPWSTAPAVQPDIAYWGVPANSGAVIQAEDFDHGGNGIGYYSNSTNKSGQYRPREAVSIETSSDAGGGFDVNNTVAGEWLGYGVSLAQSGTYQADFRVASAASGGKFYLEIDGQNVTGQIAVPATGGAQTWQTLSVTGVQLAAGVHNARLVFDALGTGGTVGSFNWFKLTTTAASPIPAAPTNLAATAVSATVVNLTWHESSTNQNGFLIERSADGVNFVQIGATAAAVSSFSDNTVAAGTTYSYRVRATAAAGNSAYSNVLTVTTPGGATVIATYLSDLPWVSATAGWGTVQKDHSIAGNPITLNGVTYAKGIGTHASSTIIYNLSGQYSSFISDVGIDSEENGRGIGSVDFQVLGDGKVLFDSGVLTNASATVSINVSVAGIQQLSLLAVNGVAGSIDYDHADWAGARLLAQPSVPAAPANLQAVAYSANQINLSWTDSSPGNETGFLIERSTDGVSFVQIGTTLAGVTHYSDIGLAASTSYTYRVRAINALGDSAYSAPASATTTGLLTVTYISDLAWVSATSGWGTVHKDQSVLGNPITLQGVSYAKGIGTHAPSQIVYNLGGQYTHFLSDIGIDSEEAGRVGAADFQVIGDGKVLYDSGVLTSSSPIVSIDVNVTGVQQLTLVVTAGVTGTIDYDHADWAGARLTTG